MEAKLIVKAESMNQMYLPSAGYVASVLVFCDIAATTDIV